MFFRAEQMPQQKTYSLTFFVAFRGKGDYGCAGRYLLTSSITVKRLYQTSPKSVITRSNECEKNSSSAFLPQVAVTTANPRSPRRGIGVRITSSSSTSNIFLDHDRSSQRSDFLQIRTFHICHDAEETNDLISR